MSALAKNLELLAADVGLLTRRLADEARFAHVLDRMALNIELTDAMLQPNGSEIYRANLSYCGDEDLSLKAALEDVDQRARFLRRLLGRGRVDIFLDELRAAQQQVREECPTRQRSELRAVA